MFEFDKYAKEAFTHLKTDMQTWKRAGIRRIPERGKKMNIQKKKKKEKKTKQTIPPNRA